PTIFSQSSRGLVASSGLPFLELLHRRGRPVTIESWELHLSTIFTEVRSYGYIEVRSADLQPDARILSVPALYTGLLYHPDGPARVWELCQGHASHEAWNEAMDSAARLGLEGAAGGRPLRELAAMVLASSIEGLRDGAACAGTSPDPARPV